jgi:RNA polymerase-binding transcription factor DksA
MNSDTHQPPLHERDLQRQHEVLIQRRDAIRAELMSQLSESERLADASADPQVRDWKDTAFAHQLAGVHSTAIGQLREELTEVGEALARVADGSYGTCTQCGRHIADQRLAVQPAASRCLDCQSRAEQQV